MHTTLSGVEHFLRSTYDTSNWVLFLTDTPKSLTLDTKQVVDSVHLRHGVEVVKRHIQQIFELNDNAFLSIFISRSGTCTMYSPMIELETRTDNSLLFKTMTKWHGGKIVFMHRGKASRLLSEQLAQLRFVFEGVWFTVFCDFRVLFHEIRTRLLSLRFVVRTA